MDPSIYSSDYQWFSIMVGDKDYLFGFNGTVKRALHSANTLLPAGVDIAVLDTVVYVPCWTSMRPPRAISFGVGIVSVRGGVCVEGARFWVWTRDFVEQGVPEVVVASPGRFAFPVRVAFILSSVFLVERPERLHHSVNLRENRIDNIFFMYLAFVLQNYKG